LPDFSFENITYDRDGRIARITINRPDRLNAINPDTSAELYDAWSDFRDDPDLWVAILTGVGDKSFSSGMDLVATATGESSKQQRRGYVPFGGNTKRMRIWKPMIAAINGHCLAGGCEMALACDIRIASPNATFGLPEVRWSLIPGAGGTQRLPRSIPQAWANYMILTGERIDAETALRLGLISHIVPAEELQAKATEIAEMILERGPLAVRAAKEAINRGQDMSLDDGLEFEDLLFSRLQFTEDVKEGPRAFAEKRKPVFQGR
jgi:enoyl-CoA hydratase/carnithine racemase